MPMQVVPVFSKYLGMPTIIGRSKREVFNYIQDRIWQKLKWWKERHLSYAGKTVLIQVVAQAIPTYIMSCLHLPKGFCNHIEKMVCNFWWGSNVDKNKFHWIKWSKLCTNKKKGGPGFRNLNLFNEALLAKQGWRLSTNENSLISRVFKAKYHPKCPFSQAKPTSNMSYTWNNILKARHILNQGSYWRVGDGKSINIWSDKWLPNQHGHKVWTPKPPDSTCNLVKDLINYETNSWKAETINNLFLPFEAEQILQIPTLNRMI